VRGAPIELARVDDRFVEVYVVDDDRSFQGADLVGQSVYRRDLRTGDSSRVFTDSIVPALAREYARTHPDDEPLGPDQDGDDNPELRATATLEFSAMHGPFVSYSLHTDVERGDAPFWHTSRHGVLDLRTGKPAQLADIAGKDASAIEHRRDEMLQSVLDSARVRAAGLLSRYRFDPSSFSIAAVNGAPAIAYAIPTVGSGEMDQTLPLPLVPFAQPTWWQSVVPSLPTTSSDGAVDTWHHGSVSVLARYDSSGDAHLALRDSSKHEWAIGPVSGAPGRIYWLDRSSFDPEMRHALVRAFDDAATYGDDTHVAARTARTLLSLASHKR
jgi:hypothetical protein